MKKITPILMSLSLVATAVWAEKSVDETRPADGDARVSVEIVSGSIQVTGWSRNEVHVSGSIGDDVDGLEVSGSGRSIVIELDIPDGWGRRRREIDADLEISVPTGVQLTVETVSADINVDGLDGTVELATVSGGIELAGRPTRADVETVSGNILVAGEQTAITAESVSGDVVLRGVAETVEAASVSGDIEVAAREIERANFESVSGDVEFSGELGAQARLHAEAHSGNVTLLLPADTSATWEVETFSGNVTNEFGPEAERTSEHGPGKWLKFTTGSGEARITVDSFSGNVKFRKR